MVRDVQLRRAGSRMFGVVAARSLGRAARRGGPRRDDGQLEFHALPSLSSYESDLLQAVRIRVLRFLAHAGVIDDARELALVGFGA
jgi:hypothetical protein